VLASSSHVAAIHVKHRSPKKIAKIVRFLQEQDSTGVIFTRPRPFGGDVVDGWVPGTFSLELVHLDNAERGADIVVTFDWSSEKNPFGISGTDTRVGSGATGPRTGNASGHGSMSPWNVRNTWLAWGVDFKEGIVNRVPSSNVDIAPTILALNGLDSSELDGRVLVEALEGGPDYEKIPLETRTYISEHAGYRALIQVTEVGHQRYIDKSWRLP
jgi:arylsulfatase A-like enzyme